MEENFYNSIKLTSQSVIPNFLISISLHKLKKKKTHEQFATPACHTISIENKPQRFRGQSDLKVIMKQATHSMCAPNVSGN